MHLINFPSFKVPNSQVSGPTATGDERMVLTHSHTSDGIVNCRTIKFPKRQVARLLPFLNKLLGTFTFHDTLLRVLVILLFILVSLFLIISNILLFIIYSDLAICLSSDKDRGLPAIIFVVFVYWELLEARYDLYGIYFSVYSFGTTISFLPLKIYVISITNRHNQNPISKIQSSHRTFLITHKYLTTPRIKGEATDVCEFVVFVLDVTRSTVLHTTKYLEKFPSRSTVNSYLIGCGDYKISAIGIEVCSYRDTAGFFSLFLFGGLKCFTTRHFLFWVLTIFFLIFQIIRVVEYKSFADHGQSLETFDINQIVHWEISPEVCSDSLQEITRNKVPHLAHKLLIDTRTKRGVRQESREK